MVAMNKAAATANAKLIATTIANRPLSITEIQNITGLSRPTVRKWLGEIDDVKQIEGAYPPKYYVGEADETLAEEQRTDKKKNAATETARASIAQGITFFPELTKEQQDKAHDWLLDPKNEDIMAVLYRKATSSRELLALEHNVKVLFDMIQYRKSLKEFKE